MCLSGEKCLPTTLVNSESGKCVRLERNVYPRLLLTLNLNVSQWREMSTHDSVNSESGEIGEKCLPTTVVNSESGKCV